MGGLAVSFKIGKCRGNSKFSKVLLFSLFGFVFAFYRNVQLAYQFKLLEWDIDDNLSSYYWGCIGSNPWDASFLRNVWFKVVKTNLRQIVWQPLTSKISPTVVENMQVKITRLSSVENCFIAHVFLHGTYFRSCVVVQERICRGFGWVVLRVRLSSSGSSDHFARFQACCFRESSLLNCLITLCFI